MAFKRAAQAGALLGIVAIGGSTLGQAQGKPARRGAPSDWSHSHLIASRFGPDLDQAIGSDWRTYNRHVRRDLVLAAMPQALLNQFPSVLASRSPARQTPVRNPVLGADGTIPHLDWSLSTGGYGAASGDPAKYSWDIASANCADVIYYTVNQPGSSTAANVIAITNPYSTCTGNSTGTTPTVKFALRLPSGTATSAVPSLDGTVLYVLESGASSTILHAIKVNNITTSPGSYDFVNKAWTSVHTLAASPIGTATSEQLFQLTLTGSALNNVSSPYLDYSNNQLFVGDAGGKIHRIINTHLATASEYVGNGFPVACGTRQLTSPVFAADQVIVSSADGFLYRINMLLGPVPAYASIRTAQAGTGVGAEGGLSSPIVDITNSKIILTTGSAFVDPTVKGIGTFELMFSAGNSYLVGVPLGDSDGFASTTPAFDESFYASNNGFAYVTGNSSGNRDTFLIKVPYNGTFGFPSGYARLNGGTTEFQTTSVTAFLTASTATNKEFLYVGGWSASTSTVRYMNRFVSNFGGSDTSPVNFTSSFAAPGEGVASGVVIDNRTGMNITNGLSTANIYYGTRGLGTTTKSTIVQLNQEF